MSRASSYVLSWEVSVTMDDDVRVNALKSVLSKHRLPDISNSDKGAQNAVKAFTGALKNHGVQISTDISGSCMDNIFIERLWWSVKYEKIFLDEFEAVLELLSGLQGVF
jgi:putative transposase